MKKRTLIFVAVIMALLASAVTAAGQMSIGGEVVDVVNGKTVVIAAPTGRVTAELQFIDVPEVSQDLCETVKQHLGVLVLGKRVTYRAQTLFRDRTVGRLMLDSTDVSMQMLRDGAAWHLPLSLSGQDNEEFKAYAATESFAKSEKRGVWSVPDLKPAWIVRAESVASAN